MTTQDIILLVSLFINGFTLFYMFLNWLMNRKPSGCAGQVIFQITKDLTYDDIKAMDMEDEEIVKTYIKLGDKNTHLSKTVDNDVAQRELLVWCKKFRPSLTKERIDKLKAFW